MPAQPSQANVPQSIDWPGIRTLAVTIGVREAARQVGRDLPPVELRRFTERVMKRSQRQGWITSKIAAIEAKTVKANAGRANQIEAASIPLSGQVRTSAQAIEGYLSEASQKVRKGLAKACVTASEYLGDTTAQGVIKSAKNMRDVAATASQVFAWQDRSQSGVNLQFNIGIGGME